jgi:hypothetical protein
MRQAEPDADGSSAALEAGAAQPQSAEPVESMS